MNQNISHAIAYMDVFMACPTMDEPHGLSVIYENIDTLSTQEVVGIIIDSVKCSHVYGSNVILREMYTNEFNQYVRKRIDQIRDILMGA